MSIYHVAISFPMDTALPRDEMSIHPHYGGDNPQALANALKTNLIANSNVTTKPFKIKVYDAQKPVPNFPLATAEQTGAVTNNAAPRELALCLSYYSTYNRPRYRGRLYIPFTFVGGSLALRPTTTQMNNVLAWGATLKTGLPPNTSWCVYSKVANQYYGVSNYWVDNEWDIVRTRGLRGDTRVLGTVP